MSTVVNVEEAPQLEEREPIARPAPIPESRLEALFDGNLNRFERRVPSSASSSAAQASVSCGPHNTTGVCERYVDATSNTTMPIVLGVVIPLAVAFIIFAFLHRRHVKKLRFEDANDPHQSLDFGMADGPESKKSRSKKDAPEMSMAEAKETLRRDRGLSMDMSSGNPYLLPPGLQQSRESIHSLSRALGSEDDRWSRATSYIPNDGSHAYPARIRKGGDDSSSFTGSSSRRTGITEGDSQQNLIRHAQRISRTYPNRKDSTTSPTDALVPRGQGQNGLLAPSNSEQVRDSYVSTASSNGHNAALRASNDYLGAFIRGGFTSTEEEKQKKDTEPAASNTPQINEPVPSTTIPEHTQQPQLQQSQDTKPTTSIYEQVTATEPRRQPVATRENEKGVESMRVESPPEPSRGLRHAFTLPQISIGETSDFKHEPTLPQVDLPAEQDYDEDVRYDPRRLTTEIRPLPPDDPSENPEQRANRIRSFYKEYFEETKPGSKPTHQSYYDGSEEYADYGYGQNQDYDAAYDPAYDPSYNYPQYSGPDDYSRSMTPPPRGPPRFMGTAHKPRSMSGSSLAQGRPRAFSNTSGAGYNSPRGGRGTPTQKKKQLPPPAPLSVLPTPHMLKDDNIMLNLQIDFAPPQLAKIRRAGTPDSLRGGVRPYSPALPAHIPLTSSFDDLAVMPSP